MKRAAAIPLLLCLLCAAGCDLIGVLTYKIAGPMPVPAKYVPAKTPMLVLVENYRHQSAAAAPSDLLARQLAHEILTHNIALVVPPERLQELRDAKPVEFPKMSITAIGKEVGASQILYVQLLSSDVTPLAGGEAFTGSATASVKIVDVASGQTLWPIDMSDGYPVAARTQLGSQGPGTAMEVRQHLSAQMADQIAKLLRKWTPDDMAPEGYTQ